MTLLGQNRGCCDSGMLVVRFFQGQLSVAGAKSRMYAASAAAATATAAWWKT